MNLIKRKRNECEQPTSSLARLRGEMDSLFERFFRDPWAREGDARGGFPRTDLAESENHVTVTMELPGMDAQDLEINIAGGLLTVRGEKKQEKSEKHKNYHYVERQYGTFQRSVQLPSYVNSTSADATYRNGVLTITVPKTPALQPKRIPLKAT